MFGKPKHPVLDEVVDIGEMQGTTLRECRYHADQLAYQGAANTVYEQGLAMTIVYLIDRLVEAE